MPGRLLVRVENVPWFRIASDLPPGVVLISPHQVAASITLPRKIFVLPEGKTLNKLQVYRKGFNIRKGTNLPTYARTTFRYIETFSVHIETLSLSCEIATQPITLEQIALTFDKTDAGQRYDGHHVELRVIQYLPARLIQDFPANATRSRQPPLPLTAVETSTGTAVHCVLWRRSYE